MNNVESQIYSVKQSLIGLDKEVTGNHRKLISPILSPRASLQLFRDPLVMSLSRAEIEVDIEGLEGANCPEKCSFQTIWGEGAIGSGACPATDTVQVAPTLRYEGTEGAKYTIICSDPDAISRSQVSSSPFFDTGTLYPSSTTTLHFALCTLHFARP